MDINKIQQSLRELPLGDSRFVQLRQKNMLVVDKTASLAELAKGSTVFISRPRRFGKSMLLAMLQELFTHGAKDNPAFDGMAVQALWQQNIFPVVRLSFLELDDPKTIEERLRNKLCTAFVIAGFKDAAALRAQRLTLTETLGELETIVSGKDFVCLIDEWDFPLSANLNQRGAFNDNLKVLRQFYSWLRELPELWFTLITGIGRYQHTQIWTGQDVRDLSLEPKFADLLGYTQYDLKTCFADYVAVAADRLHLSADELLAKLELQYDGFCFDQEAKIKVYCPFSINNFFAQIIGASNANTIPAYGSYWVNNANPSGALREYLKRFKPDLSYLEQDGVQLTHAELMGLNSFDDIKFDNIMALSGFLTIKNVINPQESSPESRLYNCSFPNIEVKSRYLEIFIGYMLERSGDSLGKEFAECSVNLGRNLLNGDVASSVQEINFFLRNFHYETWASAHENAFRSLVAVSLRWALGINAVREEVPNNDGRTDIEAEVGADLLVLELKLFSDDIDLTRPHEEGKFYEEKTERKLQQLACTACDQIRARGYASQYRTYQRVFGLGLVICRKSRQVAYWRLIDANGVLGEKAVIPLAFE